MKCFISKYSGFCFGVSLAVNTAYENLNDSTYMLGEVVHNPVVVSDLKDKGMGIINTIDEIQSFDNPTVLIRAHGVPEKTIKELQRNSVKFIDKTCPKVKRIHNIVAEASERGLEIIVVGNSNHPEIIGTSGWSKTKTIIIKDIESARETIPNTVFSEKGVCIVAQTTHNKYKYEEIYSYCSTIIPNIEYHETICDDTANRQNEIRNLSKKVDSVIVVGGKTSSNSTKLFEIASEYCKNTQHIESEMELDIPRLADVVSVVISSGASTPDSSVVSTMERIHSFCKSKGISFDIINLKNEH